MISLEPVDLIVLAEHLRDGTWLDVRVCDVGVLERVQVEQILVHRDGDQLRFIQEVVDGDELLIQGYLVDNDSIMYARPTVFEAADVSPPEAPPHQARKTPCFGVGLDAAEFALLVNIVHALEDVTQLQDSDNMLARLEVREEQNRMAPWVRHYVLWALYELTNLSQREVCVAVGYTSIQPWVSTRQEIGREQKVRKEITALVAATQRRMGTRLALRTHNL